MKSGVDIGRAKKKSRIFYATAVLFFIFFFSWCMLHVGGGEEAERKKVSVIVDSAGESRRIAFQSGAEKAADDHHMDVNFVNAGKMISLLDQRTLIRQEIEEGAEAVILRLCVSEGAEMMLKEFENRAKIILVENKCEEKTEEGMKEPLSFSSICADDYAMGEALAKAVLENRKHDLRIGVITGNLSKHSLKMRKAGFEDALCEVGITPVWESGAMLHLDEQIRIRQKKEKANTFVAMDDEGLRSAVDYVKRNGEKGIALYGAGYSDENVYHMDQGIIKSMAVTDTFNMGYQAVEEAGQLLRAGFQKPHSREVNFYMVRRETMFQAENQRLLFPLVE